MPKLKPETHEARRQHILNAAETCFAQYGFHGTRMQHICAEAKISAGALYIYFDSKEALIAGICARDRARFTERFAPILEADDFLGALTEMANTYLCEDPSHRLAMHLEIGAEAARNPAISEMFAACDTQIRNGFAQLFNQLKADGRIDPAVSLDDLVRTVMVLVDGIMWRRTVDPDFDAGTMVPAVLQSLALLIRPLNTSRSETSHFTAMEPQR